VEGTWREGPAAAAGAAAGSCSAAGRTFPAEPGSQLAAAAADRTQLAWSSHSGCNWRADCWRS